MKTVLPALSYYSQNYSYFPFLYFLPFLGFFFLATYHCMVQLSALIRPNA